MGGHLAEHGGEDDGEYALHKAVKTLENFTLVVLHVAFFVCIRVFV